MNIKYDNNSLPIIFGSATKGMRVDQLLQKLTRYTKKKTESYDVELEVFKVQNKRYYVKVK